jgi:uncharacterized protein
LAALEIELGGERVQLLPGRAAHLPAHEALLVADVHLGKAHSFRRLGVPVPSGSTDDTLARLDTLLAATGARQLVFLGDLLHAARGRSAALDAAVGRAIDGWRARQPGLELWLVRGNHDRHAGDPPADWGVRSVAEPLRRGGLALSHHPDPQPGTYVVAGHLHPAVTLGGRAHERLRLPCFHVGPAVAVLPAFGAFTGNHVVRPAVGDRVFVVDGQAVRALPLRQKAQVG